MPGFFVSVADAEEWLEFDASEDERERYANLWPDKFEEWRNLWVAFSSFI